MILRPIADELHLLLIKRAEHPEDPWSGHMALPGGRRDESDIDDLTTAYRETLEEVGLNLAKDGEYLGALDHLRASARGRPVDMVISPFVFYLKTLTLIVPNSEVVSTHWVAIRSLLDGRTNIEHVVKHPEGTFTVPAWGVEGNPVWGLTYRMIRNFFDLMSQSSSRIS
jgi:8-oxo-dGTP pyrophosphatase MutT (NUDIX family)